MGTPTCRRDGLVAHTATGAGRTARRNSRTAQALSRWLGPIRAEEKARMMIRRRPRTLPRPDRHFYPRVRALRLRLPDSRRRRPVPFGQCGMTKISSPSTGRSGRYRRPRRQRHRVNPASLMPSCRPRWRGVSVRSCSLAAFAGRGIRSGGLSGSRSGQCREGRITSSWMLVRVHCCKTSRSA